ncbi:MAG: lysophospholipase [Eubacterium sp.]|nr:lysophospholipase [Eubacterium sp.]
MRPNTVTFPPEGVKPLGIIQFVHGMCEYRNRYFETMKRFNEKGFICAITDLRGHGENIMSQADLGHFGDNVTYKDLVEDVHDYTMFLKREYPNLPLILLGHSMGSLIVRTYVKKYSKEIDALIISGSPSNNSFAGIAKFMIRCMVLFKGWRYHSETMAKLVTGPFDKAFDKEGITNTWLTRNRNIVDAYNADPLCGFTFSLNGYYVLMELIQQVYSKKGWVSKNPKLPVMFMSGANDPCKGSERAFKKAVTHFKHCGFQNTYSKLYPDMRHELFNELENDIVYTDILKFLEIKAGIEFPI